MEESGSSLAFVSLDTKSTLYTLIDNILAESHGWLRKASPKARFNLLLAKVHGADIPWEILNQADGMQRAVNYFRGCSILMRKADTHRTLQGTSDALAMRSDFYGQRPPGYCEATGVEYARIAPRTFVLRSMQPLLAAVQQPGLKGMVAKGHLEEEERERQVFRGVLEARAGRTEGDSGGGCNANSNAWICKPNRGGKGQGIKIFTEVLVVESIID